VAQVSDPSILRLSRNCWQIAKAERAAVLIDGADYFAAAEAALRQARRSVLIVGWDFDGRVRLRQDVSPEESPPLGPFLRSLVEARPQLAIRILVWSIAVVHAPSAPGPLLFGADWQYHPQLRLKLDTQHPIYAAHHQKIVCIDDRIAFVGGMDFTVRRWDTPRHAIDNPYRLGPEGRPYEPVHDVSMAVDGGAARCVAALARRRWQVATGEALDPMVDPGADPWPADLRPDFTDSAVAIARTMPAWGADPPVAEAAKLTADALRAAKRAIYIEAQYMTAPFVGDILERHLQEPDGPEIIVLMTLESRGFAERLVMGNNRDRLIRRLRRADGQERLRVWYPCILAPDGGGRQVKIHSKLIIVDDAFLRVGSSNLNNRSIGLDTECDLAIETRTWSERRAVSNLRNRLIAEHLDVDPVQLATAILDEGGSLIRAIERLNRGSRSLRPFAAMSDRGPSRPVLGTGLLDPEGPFEPLWLLRRKRRQRG
jgi:phosphatidylserine/phosphatidylglycerophosphate/cardiolipin synthase-like enzyme